MICNTLAICLQQVLQCVCNEFASMSAKRCNMFAIPWQYVCKIVQVLLFQVAGDGTHRGLNVLGQCLLVVCLYLGFSFMSRMYSPLKSVIGASWFLIRLSRFFLVYISDVFEGRSSVSNLVDSCTPPKHRKAMKWTQYVA